jgi:hypothetical protein
MTTAKMQPDDYVSFSNSCGSGTLTHSRLQAGGIPGNIIPCPRPSGNQSSGNPNPAHVHCYQALDTATDALAHNNCDSMTWGLINGLARSCDTIGEQGLSDLIAQEAKNCEVMREEEAKKEKEFEDAMSRVGLNRATMDDQVRKREAAELAALKLDWTHKLEEHVGKSCSLISIKIAVSRRHGPVATAVQSLWITPPPSGACRSESAC